MNERPLTGMQVAQIVYGALCAWRMISGLKIPPWDMLRDDQKIWLRDAIVREEEPGGQITGLAPISERDEAIISALRTVLATK